MTVVQSLLGIVVFFALAWAISENRRAFPWRIVVISLALQVVLAVLLLKAPPLQDAFLSLNRMVRALEAATNEGTAFVFGYLAGKNLPFTEEPPGSAWIFAFRGLPLILVVSALSSLLFYWGILQRVVRLFSFLLQKTFSIGGAEGVAVSANVFVGMVEAPLFIRPYLERLTRSELFSVMVVGMATIAGTVMVLYASIIGDTIPGALGHIITASIISAPAAIAVSKVMVPEGEPVTAGEVEAPSEARSAMDAITRGTMQGVELLISVIAMLIVLVALVHLVNLALGLFPSWNDAPITLQRLLAIPMAPVVWLFGIPWSEVGTAGSLMGTKTVLNEMIAYLQLAGTETSALGERSRVILTYAMCGFANPGSLGILIGGLGAMAPTRRPDIVSLGVRSIVAGTLATCLTGAIVSFLV